MLDSTRTYRWLKAFLELLEFLFILMSLELVVGFKVLLHLESLLKLNCRSLLLPGLIAFEVFDPLLLFAVFLFGASQDLFDPGVRLGWLFKERGGTN